MNTGMCIYGLAWAGQTRVVAGALVLESLEFFVLLNLKEEKKGKKKWGRAALSSLFW